MTSSQIIGPVKMEWISKILETITFNLSKFLQ
jgi:hypothetical protein